MSTIYPSEVENLLRKAKLLGSGQIEIRAIHRMKTHRVSEDGEFFQEEKRPEIEGILTGSTMPIKARNGTIAGYWANGLTNDERQTIHLEAGVPFYHLGEPINQSTGRPNHPDSVIPIKEGEILDMEIPSHVAKFMLLKEGVYIGHNRQDALDQDAMFYFYSREEEQKEMRESLANKKKAIELIGELSVKEKRQLLRIMTYSGYIAISHYVDADDVPMLFDNYCFDMPKQVYKAYMQPNKQEFIICKALIEAGHIREASSDGPYTKDENLYGKQEQLAQDFAELMRVINSHSDLKKAYYEMEEYIRNMEDSTNEFAVPSSAKDIMMRHGLMEDTTVVDETIAVINKSSKVKLFKMLREKGIEHDFTEESSLPDIRKFCIEKLV